MGQCAKSHVCLEKQVQALIQFIAQHKEVSVAAILLLQW
jgi:hypothetical protein